MRTFFVSLFVCGLMTLSYGSVNLTLANYGLEDPTDASCPTSGTGWYIDRAYDATCFVRMVRCSGGNYNGNYATCAVDQVYIADGDFTCYNTDSSVAREACDVNVICNQDSIGIVLSSGAIFNQTEGDITVGDCSVAYNSDNSQYMVTYSLLDSEWSDCGITRQLISDPVNGDGYSVKYHFMVSRDSNRISAVYSPGNTEREEEYHDGVVVTREKCFMIDAYCYYNADGTVTSNFAPSSANTLTEFATSTLVFELENVDCTDSTSMNPPAVYVGDDVCFRANIVTDWHDNIRMQITDCWAEDGQGNQYPLGHRDGTLQTEEATDSTFAWDCYDNGNPYSEYFSFQAFRFQNDTYTKMDNINSYAQTIQIFCDVVACEEDDYTSDSCFSGCRYTDSRKRREASQSVLGHYTHQVVKNRAFVLPKKASYFETPSFSYDNTFSMLMFGTGCILAAVVVGLLVALHRMKKEVKYGLVSQEARHA
jgi:hypothetical protein